MQAIITPEGGGNLTGLYGWKMPGRQDCQPIGMPEGRTPSNKDNGRENSAKGGQLPATGILFS